MKTKFFILSITGIFFAVTTYATKLPIMNVIPLSSKKTLVSFSNEEPKQVDFTIKNQRGVVLFESKSEDLTNDYRKVFNFSELEDGIYTMCLNYDNCSIYRDLLINRNYIEVRNEVRIYDPWYKVTGNKVLLTVLNPAEKNVYLKIYQGGENILRQNLGKEMAIHKLFDTSKLETGNYEFVVSDAYKDYTFTVEK